MTEEIKKKGLDVYAALFKFQGENVVVPRNGEGEVNSKKYKYATLDDTIDTIRPVMQKYKLGFTQIANDRDLETKIFHYPSGTEITGKIPLGDPKSSQDLGSRLTYLKRYALTSMLGLSVEQDVDGVQGVKVPISTPVPETKVEEDTPAAINPPSRSVPFMAANASIEACSNPDSLNLINQQVLNSQKLADNEKDELVKIIFTKISGMQVS